MQHPDSWNNEGSSNYPAVSCIDCWGFAFYPYQHLIHVVLVIIGIGHFWHRQKLPEILHLKVQKSYKKANNLLSKLKVKKILGQKIMKIWESSENYRIWYKLQLQMYLASYTHLETQEICQKNPFKGVFCYWARELPS